MGECGFFQYQNENKELCIQDQDRVIGAFIQSRSLVVVKDLSSNTADGWTWSFMLLGVSWL